MMNVSFKDFGADVPDKKHYEQGIDYLLHEFNLEFEDAFYLVESLKNNHSSVTISTPAAIVNFYIFDNALHVDIDADGFWHESNINLPLAKEILRIAWEGCGYFGSQIDGTNREWDAYCI